MRVIRSPIAPLFAVGLLFASVGMAVAQEVIDQEYDFKAVYLYNFGKYIEWPDNPFPGSADGFVIGILGKDPFPAERLRQIANRTINDKPIVIRRFKTMEEYRPCHILFVSAASAIQDNETAEDRLKAAVKATKGKPVLIVSENANFAQAGSVVNFSVDTQQNRIVLEVNLDAAKRADLKIGSSLLGLERSGALKIFRDEK